MIIKKIYIESFAGLKNVNIDFTKGFNLVFGENEKGKSTIENFIKTWLYGMENSRNKFIGRNKYLPLNGEKISGELTIEKNEKMYLIKRTFGLTKKEDTCEVLDGITGEKIDIDYKNEPGRYFFNINLSTFIKTLFIGQLGVIVSKDKEEEIMEKISNIYNSGDEDTSVKKAIDKIEKRKKQLFGFRKNGEIDTLKEKENYLKEELWEAYKLGEENLENEEKLLKRREYRNEIKEQIKKLDLYKKYIKKVKLQKDYKEISDYLIKGQELKKKQESINEDLKKGNELITLELLDEINEKSTRYLSLFDVKQEKANKLSSLEEFLENRNQEIKQYELFNSMGEDIKQKIYTLKIDQKNLEDKLAEIINVKNSIDKTKEDIQIKGLKIKNIKFIEKNRNEIEFHLNKYREELKELKYKIEIQEGNQDKSTFNSVRKKMSLIYFSGIVTLIIFLYGMFKQNIPVVAIAILLFIILVKFYIKFSLEIKNIEVSNKNNKMISELKEKILSYEETINSYLKETGSVTYEEFISNLNKYDNYKNYKDSMEIILEKRLEEIENYNITEIKSNYNKNKGVIASMFNILSCDSLDKVLDKASEYERLKDEIIRIKYEYDNLKEEIKSIEEQLLDREEEIKNKTSNIGLEDVEIFDIHVKLKEYKNKIKAMNEIKSALENVEETYKVLLKDRDIEKIKEEMKDIINQDINYSYETEDEIDDEIRKQSNMLLKIEKEINDLEHIIDKRFLGKRDISSIEEDLLINKESILKGEKEFNALELANATLKEALGEIRNNIGPDLNNRVTRKFNRLTGKNYEEIKISEDYKLKVREKGMLFDGDILSNGAKDQLYLSLRLSFIEMIFKDKNIPIFLDDAFIQYDDNRRFNALNTIIKEDLEQIVLFTCQGIEREILDNNNYEYNFIQLA